MDVLYYVNIIYIGYHSVRANTKIIKMIYLKNFVK